MTTGSPPGVVMPWPARSPPPARDAPAIAAARSRTTASAAPTARGTCVVRRDMGAQPTRPRPSRGATGAGPERGAPPSQLGELRLQVGQQGVRVVGRAGGAPQQLAGLQ